MTRSPLPFEAGVPKEKAGILVDEQFGAAILRDASAAGYTTACPAEKSGQEEFDFEYGEDFGKHIEAFHPTFCKVLVRYNPEGDAELNRRQAARLKRLSDYLHSNQSRSRFMFELLVPAEKAQLERFQGDKKAYDLELRPQLMAQTIEQLQDAGVEPDVWKIEGLEQPGRLRERSWPLRAAEAATRWVASSWAAVKTTRKSANGSRPQRPCLASSALRSAGRASGIRWSIGAARRSRRDAAVAEIARRYQRVRGDLRDPATRLFMHRGRTGMKNGERYRQAGALDPGGGLRPPRRTGSRSGEGRR